MYNYYQIKTEPLSKTLNTIEIEEFLRSYKIFDEANGVFTCKSHFLDISLMKVKDPDSWSSLDYSPTETNYIDIITSSESDNDIFVKELLKKLELVTGYRINKDTC